MGSELLFSLILICTGFLPSSQNSKPDLAESGHSSEAIGKHADLTRLFKFMKRFHIFMGISLFAICTILRRISDISADVFLVTYPMLCYSFFIIRAEKFHPVSSIRKFVNRAISAFLIFLIIIILFLAFIFFKNSEMIVGKNQIEITGMYGLTVMKQDITEIELTNCLPAVTYKINGFDYGRIVKGEFGTRDGQKLYFFGNRKSTSFLLLKTTGGDVYFGFAQIDLPVLYRKVKLWKEGL
jgi:hypothetical protein